ncbi:unnamed protein product [Heterobilharzia americana]|nr:unnamed protein product [Heterobilharzia americana]
MRTFYNYLVTPDDAHPLFRMKMAVLTAHTISSLVATCTFFNALSFGRNLTQAGVVCIERMLIGAAMGLSHSSISFISAKGTGKPDSAVNHAVGGFASGLIGACKCRRSMRIFAASGLAIASLAFKYSVLFKKKYPDYFVPVVGERYPAPYISLNHRWMNKHAKEEEEELELDL